MEKNDKIWIKLMDWFSKYWGCHQMPERSFFAFGYQFPVCARCTGIIVGYILSIFCIFLRININMITSVILIIPMAIDGTIQFFTNYLSNNTKRFITGILAGYGFIQFIKHIIFIFIN